MMRLPHDYPRRLLVAVTGSSPAIVTETLYVLAVSQPKRFVPTEVRLITTEVGAKRAKGSPDDDRPSLLRPDSGGFHRLRADYDLPPIAFGPERIHVLEDAGGQPLGDIRSPEDNECAADTITDLVRDLTGDDDSALHVSIAGGRKTMGFYLGYAISLFGRAQDRLSHVLVDEPYERCPDFFYPTPRSALIRTSEPESRSVDARDAKVTLADIPFVRLREDLNPELMKGTVSYSAAVADAQRAQRAPPPLALGLDPATCTVTAGGESFHMKPAWFATYWMLAERARRGKPGVHCLEEGVAKERFGYYGRVVNPMSGDYQRAEEAYFGKDGADSDRADERRLAEEHFNPDKSNIKRVLVKHLGRRRAEPYLIKKQDRPIHGKRIHRYGLALPPEAIRIASGKIARPESTVGNRDNRRQEKP